MKTGHVVKTVAMVLVLAGCTGSRTSSNFLPFSTAPNQTVTSAQKGVSQTALSLLGTPYRFGGTTPEGFDCSGFVNYVYRKSAGMMLPRESHDLVRAGKQVSATNLLPADIVYFKIEHQKPLHVGIYLGGGKFIHAPSRRGKVNIQSLDQDYWKTRYLGARRIFSDEVLIADQ
jgi:cell wall-associated NlpC family hydrolase